MPSVFQLSDWQSLVYRRSAFGRKKTLVGLWCQPRSWERVLFSELPSSVSGKRKWIDRELRPFGLWRHRQPFWEALERMKNMGTGVYLLSDLSSSVFKRGNSNSDWSRNLGWPVTGKKVVPAVFPNGWIRLPEREIRIGRIIRIDRIIRIGRITLVGLWRHPARSSGRGGDSTCFFSLL